MPSGGPPTSTCPRWTRRRASIALGENVTVFHGYQAAGMRGITECTSHEPVLLAADVEKYPSGVAQATNVLRQAGIAGPYGLAIGPDIYTRVSRGHRARWPLTSRPPPPDPGRPPGMGARCRRRHRAQFAGRGLPLRLRAGPVGRLPGPRRRHGPFVPRRKLQLQSPRTRRRRRSPDGELTPVQAGTSPG